MALATDRWECWLSSGIAYARSRVEKLLDEISQELATAAVQVNAVAMKPPAVELPNLIMTFVQDKLPERIAIERQKVEAREGVTRGREDEFVHPLMEGKIAHRFLARDVLEDGAVLLNAPVGFGLERVRRAEILPNGNQRAESDACRGVPLQAAHNRLHILTIPLWGGLGRKMLREAIKPGLSWLLGTSVLKLAACTSPIFLFFHFLLVKEIELLGE
jgi:hypothetical protein